MAALLRRLLGVSSSTPLGEVGTGTRDSSMACATLERWKDEGRIPNIAELAQDTLLGTSEFLTGVVALALLAEET